MADKKEDKVMKITATYEKESKRFSRFLVDTNEEGIVGTLYFPKGKSPNGKTFRLTFIKED